MGLSRNLRLVSFFKFTFLFIFAAVLSACSRSVPEKLELQIAVPSAGSNNPYGQSVSSLSGDEELQFVVLNLRDSETAPPKVFHFERGRDFGTVGPGGTVVLTLVGNQIPVSSTLMVQYLGGFELASTGAMKFSYGDTTINSAVNGIISANIVAASFGATSGKQVQFGGRYTTSNAPNSGPTGGLTTYFTPPAGKPDMAVERTEMIDGWFKAFALEPDGNGFPNFTFKLFDYSTQTESIIWSNVTSDSAMFTAADNDSKIQKLSLAPHFRREYRSVGYELEADPGGWYVFGYWQPASTTILNSSQGAIFSSTIETTIEGLSLDEEGLEPLAYSYTTPTASNFGRVEGDAGYGTTNMTFYPERIGSHWSEAFGFDGVFSIVNPEDRFDGAYVKSSFEAGVVNLEWSYIPLNSSFISGAVVFHKEQTAGYGDNDGGGGFSLDRRPNCFEDLAKQGYLPYVTTVTDTLNPISVSYNVTPTGQTITNPWNHKFAICPYKEVAGVRNYYPTYARNSCIGSCYDWSEQISFGRKPLNFITYVTAPTQFDQSPINGAASRITDVNVDTATGGYTVMFGTGLGVSAGDEVLIAVMGSNGTGSCGQAPGDSQIGAGEFEFGRVVAIVDTYNIKVAPRGARVLRGLSFANPTNLGYGAGVADFCYAQIVRVPHFGNLVFDNSTANITAKPFDWGSDGGGIVALRVNGTLTFSDTNNFISANHAGYSGGLAGGSAYNGSSRGGLHPLSTPATGGGRGADGVSVLRSGGGGSGAVGAGGHGENASSTQPASGGSQFNSSMGQQVNLLLGSGGGGGVNGGGDGGRGGGAVLVAARQIYVASGGNLISASGQDSPGSAIQTGGGGGGGSVNIFSLKILGGGASSLQVKTTAGNGGDSTVGYDGGGGGGGFIKVRTCGLAGGQDVFGGIPLFATSNTETAEPGTIQGGFKGTGSVNAQDGQVGLLDNQELHPMCDF